MNVDELVGIAIANAGEDRVTLDLLEPAAISTEAVSGLAQLLAELVENAVAFSEPDQTVAVSGRFDGDDYFLTVVDNGVGMSSHLLSALNHVLRDPRVHIGGPEPKLGIQLVARLASRNGIDVLLTPSPPGTTATATVPARLVRRLDGQRSVFADTSTQTREIAHAGAPRPVSTSGAIRTIDLTKYETASAGEPEPEISDTEVERFLESVFAPLKGQPGITGRPEPSTRPLTSTVREGAETTLRVRVPGENFSVSDDEPSTAAGEGAVDIRKALSSYEVGRKTAVDTGTD